MLNAIDANVASRHGLSMGKSTLGVAAIVLLAVSAISIGWAQDSESKPSALRLSANLAGATTHLTGGLHWRLFGAHAGSDGVYPLIAESTNDHPIFSAAGGDYVVHVSFGLASAIKPVVLTGSEKAENLTINAGALRLIGTLGDTPIDPAKLGFSIYVSERNNPAAKLVYSKARAGDVVGVPEGAYHIVSTYLDTNGGGGGKGAQPATPTNSIINADVKVPAGKIVDVALRHRCATLTVKLVNNPGDVALANSNFWIVTPDGDVIRELIGAFPSLVLAEGEYVAVARRDGKTYQSPFKVESGVDHDVEVVARDPVKQDP